MEEKMIDQLRCVEQEILDVIHQVCVNNNLKYSLAYGTLLGAVRHEGFIPWDDDIDIMMPRKDYQKLIEVWEKCAPSEFILENCYSSSDYPNNFLKIRKNHTTFLQSELEREKKYHKGIFVDIFPVDRVAKEGIARKFQYIMCAIALLYNRGYTSGSEGIVGVIEKLLLKIPKSKYKDIQRWAEKKVTAYNADATLQCFSFCTISDCKTYFQPNLFEDLIMLPFNGREYFAVREYHDCLTVQYGDYMKLPPESERVWKHHPVLVDFVHNYEEIDEEMKTWEKQ